MNGGEQVVGWGIAPSPWGSPADRKTQNLGVSPASVPMTQTLGGGSPGWTTTPFEKPPPEHYAFSFDDLRRGRGVGQQGLTGNIRHYPPGRLTGPVRFFAKLLDLWKLNAESGWALLGYDESEKHLVSDLLAGATSLRGRDAKDRIATLFRIQAILKGLFRNIDAENEWLRAPQSALGERSPMELLLNGSMEKMLTVRQLVERMAGL